MVVFLEQGSSAREGDGGDVAMPRPGDDLILILEKMTVDPSNRQDVEDRWAYMLPNHLEGGAAGGAPSVKMVFPLDGAGHLQRDQGMHQIWQLVPSVASMSNRSCWDRKGFWRVGMVR